MEKNNLEADTQFETKIVRTKHEQTDPYHAIAMPVYHTAAFEFESAEEMERVFCGEQAGYFYSRVSNPTVSYFENRIRETTGAYGVTAFNSGMAAIQGVLMAIASAGSNIVTTCNLFGNTYSLLNNVLSNFGVETRFCDLKNAAVVKAAIDSNTCALFVEVISNPQMEVVDLKMLATLAKERNIPLIVDSTAIPFCAFQAKQLGINLEVVSSTKYISGGGTSTGGLVIDYATFDWSHSKVMKNWHSRFSEKAFTMRMQRDISRNLGGYMSPHAAYMQTLGLETLPLRYEQQATNCLELAKKLQALPQIQKVHYPGLADNPYYHISRAQFGKHSGAMLTFELDSREACFAFLNRLKLIRKATNLFDNRSLIIHPASTIYGPLSKEQREHLNVHDRLIRLSVGLEGVNDLYNDICQALND